jgi:hypothetical protein
MINPSKFDLWVEKNRLRPVWQKNLIFGAATLYVLYLLWQHSFHFVVCQ